MNRDKMLDLLEDFEGEWDVIIIGGGATGLGAALDASSRGFRTLLLEQSDFAKGTSSRSTKLIHGGLRYLQQGNISLVVEALKERGLLCANAPHLVAHLPFLVPNYKWWEGPFYGIGIKLYDLLAGKLGLEPSKKLSVKEALKEIPTLEKGGLRGAITYYDGQFDDARLAISIAQTAASYNAVLLNYMRVNSLVKKKGLICGVNAVDKESGKKYKIKAKVVINATGPFVDALRKIDNSHCKKVLYPSQGVHIVLSASFMPSKSAILVPHTEDGRVIFLVPWLGKVLVGTTDTAVPKIELEPKALHTEIAFLLKTITRYLSKSPTEKDILSVFAGLRPLVKQGKEHSTATLSRDHTILVSSSGLVTVTGGKWTTYRKMAQDVIDKAILVGHLSHRECVTENLKLHGYKKGLDPKEPWSTYGSYGKKIKSLMRKQKKMGKKIHVRLPYYRAEVIWAVRHEMARTVEDVLARRTRALLLDATAACESAEKVASLMAQELKESQAWQKKQVSAFLHLAKNYIL